MNEIAVWLHGTSLVDNVGIIISDGRCCMVGQYWSSVHVVELKMYCTHVDCFLDSQRVFICLWRQH